MGTAPTDNEELRLAALQGHLVPDFLSDGVFQRLASVMARLFGTPFAALSLVDAGKQIVKASYGLDQREIPREHSFCAHTILSGQVMVVPDARKDSRFRHLPAVVGPPGIRFYAGAPLETPSGFRIGTLSILDTRPRKLSAARRAALRDLAGMAMEELRTRLAAGRALAYDREEKAGEAEYRELFENASDIVYTHDLQGNLTSVNKAALRLTGYRREEVLGTSLFDLIEPESRELAREMMRHKLGGMPQTTYEVTIVAKDSRRINLEVGTRLLFRGGVPSGVQGIARDITERKRAEAQLRLLRSVVVNSNDGVMVADVSAPDPLDSRVVYVNEAFCRITGYSTEDILGAAPRLLHGPATNPVQLQEIRASLGRLQPIRTELLCYRKDASEFWVEANVVPIVDEKGASLYWVSVLRETTGRKLAEILERDRNQILELVAGNQPMEEVLAHLARMVERQWPRSACSLLLAREGRLFCGAAPSLPAAYLEAMNGLEVAPSGGPWSAAYWGHPVSVPDIADGKIPRDLADLLAGLGLPACWCMPILSGEGKPLGVFVAHLRDARKPEASELELLEMVSRVAAVAIEQRQLNDQLAHQARHDALTGLPNRLLFEQRLHQALLEARRHDWLAAVFFIDLDRFKQINDTLGHSVGDALLRQVSARFGACLRKSDILARMGGDEFTLVASELKETQDALRIAQKLLDSLREPFQVDAYELFLTASIGISVYPRDGRDAAALQRNADNAMYRAKNRGKNRFQFFTPDLGVAALEQLEIENALRRAIDGGELLLYYQPQVRMDGALAGFEALLAWNHPKLGVIPPGQFIPVAEECGLIVPIGLWVLTEACRQGAAWQQSGHGPVRVAVNVSPMQFARSDFIDSVAHALAHSGLDPSLLELELTENVVMRDVEESGRQMERLRALGVSISLDDFGTGYSYLSYLRRLPIDTLKIDQSFLQELDADPNTLPLLQAIIGLAHGLGLRVVAEGVETAAQFEALRSLSCDMVQGYFSGAPVPASSAERLLLRGRSVIG